MCFCARISKKRNNYKKHTCRMQVSRQTMCLTRCNIEKNLNV